MMDITVIAESTPGPIAINCATYVGYKQKGFAGSLAATLGIILPSFVIIYLISLFLENFLQITWIAHAFAGIRIAVGIIILDAGLKMVRKMKNRKFALSVILCSGVAMLVISLLSLRISSVVLMVIAALVSIIRDLRTGQEVSK